MRVDGEIVRIKDKIAFVRAQRSEACTHCANSGLCNKTEVNVCAHNDIGASVGDYVTVETNEDRAAIGIFAYLFLTPLAILFLSYCLFTVTPWLALAAIPKLIAYWVILRKINKSHPVRARIIARALPPEDCSVLKNTTENDQ